MAAPTIVGTSATADFGTDGSITPALPVGWAAGDLFVAFEFVRNASQTVDTPTGWTKLISNESPATGMTGAVFLKQATAGETTTTFTNSTTSTQPSGCVIVAIRGWSGTIADVLVSATTSNSNSVATAAAVETTTNENMILRLYGIGDDNAIVSGPAGHTQEFTELTTLGSDAGMHIYSQTQATAGSTGSAALDLGFSDPFLAWTVATPPTAEGSGSGTGTVSGTATVSSSGVGGIVDSGADFEVVEGTAGQMNATSKQPDNVTAKPGSWQYVSGEFDLTTSLSSLTDPNATFTAPTF